MQLQANDFLKILPLLIIGIQLTGCSSDGDTQPYETSKTEENISFATGKPVGTNILELDQFGSAIVYNDNRIFVGAPNDTTNFANSGSVYEFNNNTRAGSWNVLRNEGTRVDVSQINRVALYNKKQGQVSLFLDYIDPAKGKIVFGFKIGIILHK